MYDFDFFKNFIFGSNHAAISKLKRMGNGLFCSTKILEFISNKNNHYFTHITGPVFSCRSLKLLSVYYLIPQPTVFTPTPPCTLIKFPMLF